MVDGREMCIYLELKHIIIDEMTLPSTRSLAFSLTHIQCTLFIVLNQATEQNLNLYLFIYQTILSKFTNEEKHKQFFIKELTMINNIEFQE